MIFVWLVTEGDGAQTTCVAATAGTITDPTCGPMDVFSVSVSGDGSTSTLSTQSVDDTVNGTRVLCGDDDVNETICVVGMFVLCYSVKIIVYSKIMSSQTLPHLLGSCQWGVSLNVVCVVVMVVV